MRAGQYGGAHRWEPTNDAWDIQSFLARMSEASMGMLDAAGLAAAEEKLAQATRTIALLEGDAGVEPERPCDLDAVELREARASRRVEAARYAEIRASLPTLPAEARAYLVGAEPAEGEERPGRTDFQIAEDAANAMVRVADADYERALTAAREDARAAEELLRQHHEASAAVSGLRDEPVLVTRHA